MKLRSRPVLPIALTTVAILALFLSLQNRLFSNSDVVQTESVATPDPMPERAPTTESPAPDKSSTQELFCRDSLKAICLPNLPADPTGQASLDYQGEMRALRVLRRIVKSNPGWTTEQIEGELVSRIYTTERREYFTKNFEWVRKALLAFIESQPAGIFSDQEKQTLLARVQRVQLDLPVSASSYADVSDLLTKSEIYYERTPKGVLRVRIGGGYFLSTTSQYNIIFTLAHELAHTIDPCELKKEPFAFPAYSRLTDCFVEQNWLQPNEAKCGEGDKVSEAFSDWLGSHILAKAIEHFGQAYSIEEKALAASNAIRDLCDDSTAAMDSIDHGPYPHPEIRIRDLYGSNPSLRNVLECRARTSSSMETASSYCRFSLDSLRQGDSQ
ncbi:MAG: hypothetical protein RBT63_03880 [Bdellovibrionales bacterium]|jgi:hypothetical protein|nr:hypothetical protein [Bdellovibrionales bacterium]